jgi:predicted membrane GTPase involved in stress response
MAMVFPSTFFIERAKKETYNDVHQVEMVANEEERRRGLKIAVKSTSSHWKKFHFLHLIFLVNGIDNPPSNLTWTHKCFLSID